MKHILFNILHFLACTGTCYGMMGDGSITYSRQIGPFRVFRESAQYDLVCLQTTNHELIAVVHDRLGNYDWFSETIREAIVGYFNLLPGDALVTTLKLGLFDVWVTYGGEGLIPLGFEPAISYSKLALSYKWMDRLFGDDYCPF